MYFDLTLVCNLYYSQRNRVDIVLKARLVDIRHEGDVSCIKLLHRRSLAFENAVLRRIFGSKAGHTPPLASHCLHARSLIFCCVTISDIIVVYRQLLGWKEICQPYRRAGKLTSKKERVSCLRDLK
jgi:hypothetical protein